MSESTPPDSLMQLLKSLRVQLLRHVQRDESFDLEVVRDAISQLIGKAILITTRGSRECAVVIANSFSADNTGMLWIHLATGVGLSGETVDTLAWDGRQASLELLKHRMAVDFTFL